MHTRAASWLRHRLGRAVFLAHLLAQPATSRSTTRTSSRVPESSDATDATDATGVLLRLLQVLARG
ncbi:MULTISPECIES: hypothetical protein [unclassified Streptomyces]|uniref:hypothetical protein n=1 Tax=unclassified Streptomyces TaxID=2593676 RepID=UPI002E243112